MADYLNPGTIRPEYGWKPKGALAGMWSMRDRNRYEDVASLQDLMMMIEAQKAQEEQTMGAPVRSAERQKKITEADLAAIVARQSGQIPGYGTSIGMGKVGEAQQHQAKGALDIGTMPGNVEAKNVENAMKVQQQRILQQRLAESANPFETLVQSPEHQRGIALEREKAGTQKDIAHITGDYHLRGIKENVAGLLKRAEISAEDKTKIKKLEQEATDIISGARQANRLLTPQEKQQIQLIYQFLGGIRQPYGMAPYQFMGQNQVQQPPLQFPGEQQNVRSFTTEAEASRAKANGLIKPGDEVIIAGRRAKVN